jgi:hypothetical protein
MLVRALLPSLDASGITPMAGLGIYGAEMAGLDTNGEVVLNWEGLGGLSDVVVRTRVSCWMVC